MNRCSKSLLLYILTSFWLQQRRSTFICLGARRQNWTLTTVSHYPPLWCGIRLSTTNFTASKCSSENFLANNLSVLIIPFASDKVIADGESENTFFCSTFLIHITYTRMKLVNIIVYRDEILNYIKEFE